MNTLTPVKGMRDLYPAEFSSIRQMAEAWNRIGRSFGYQQYESPLLESEELFLKKSSDELVKQQSYLFIDKKGRRLLLRPEMTPGLARMIAAKAEELTFPVRWQSFGQFFRYEKPQKGRTRSFYQWNVDLIGSQSIAADIEVLSVAQKSLAALGLDPVDVQIRISDRSLLTREIVEVRKIPRNLVDPVLTILDSVSKAGTEAAAEMLEDAGVPSSAGQDLLAFLGTGSWSASPYLSEVAGLLDTLGVLDWFTVDFGIIRGLGYYTGIVFEAWASRSNRAIFGGGRYDNLASLVGGKKALPAVGFAIGDVAIRALMADLGKGDDPPRDSPDILVTVFGTEFLRDSLRLSKQLREHGFTAVVYPDGDARLSKQLSYASRTGASFALICGPDEIKDRKVTLKNLDTGRQVCISRESLCEELENVLTGNGATVAVPGSATEAHTR